MRSRSEDRAILCGTVLAFLFSLTDLQSVIAEEESTVKPVFQVDVANPTKDKPQSKLWFAHESWWAWLPTRQGSAVWRRTPEGWQRQNALDQSLLDLRGRADVWSEGNTVRAVLVDQQQLAVVTLEYQSETTGYRQVGEPMRFTLRGRTVESTVETATIARDSRHRWWIAYPWQQRIWVRSTLDAEGTEWTEPSAISEEVAPDDLCAIFLMPGAVGIAWSDQKNDSVNFRRHADDAEISTWNPIEVVDSGHRTADDHIHAVVGTDGTLYLATKNSVDRVGHEQFVFRVRRPDGHWDNLLYARRTASEEPSRPIVLLGDEPANLLLLHTVYGQGGGQARRNKIVWQSVSTERLSMDLLATSRTLIGPIAGINNVTGCKAPLPSNQPWVVLAADDSGQIYEGLLEKK